MASVWQKRGTWYVGFKGPDGTRASRSTKAATKTEARRIAAELERVAERQRLGLEVLPVDDGRTLTDLTTWWLDRWCPAPSVDREKGRLKLHVEDTPLGALPLRRVTSAALDDHFRQLRAKGLSGVSCNRLRGTLRAIFNRARKQGEWHGENPVTATTPLPIERHVPETLTPSEVEALLPHVTPSWRGYLAAAALLGMRPGEPGLLRKADVNVAARTVTIRASKTGLGDVLPIPAALWPFVEAAMKTAGPWLFGNAKGAQRKPTTEALRVLRSALKRAGLVERYDHTCRRCKARATPEERAAGKFHLEAHQDRAPRWCPVCRMKLYPVAIPRRVTVYGLRHSMATALLRSGAGLHTAQRVLRHASPNTTARHYAHLVAEDLRAPLDAAFAPAAAAVPATEPVEVADVAAVAGGSSEPSPDATRLLPGTTEPQQSTSALLGNLPQAQVILGRARQELNLRPSGSKGAAPVYQGATTVHKPAQSFTRDGSPGVPPTQPDTGFSTPNATRLLPDPSRPSLRSLAGGYDDLLSVREVAKRLRVSTATVYDLANRGELAHVRVSNAIRVAPADLAAFVTSRRKEGR